MDDTIVRNSTNPMGDSGERMTRNIEERGEPSKTSI
jgi:hypothetical protein